MRFLNYHNIKWIKSFVARLSVLSLLCLGLGLLSMLPVYGGGGHGPMCWRTLAELLNELNLLYGAGAIPIVYGVTPLLLGGYLLVKNRKGQNRQQKRKSCF